MARDDNPASEFDPRALIYESYQIDNIKPEECRSIFFDWAMGSNEGAGTVDHIGQLVEIYAKTYPDHPMTLTLLDGLRTAQKPRRRGGWKSRRN